MANGTLAASQLEMLSQSGTGIITIVPPATNTNRTLTLPDSTGTLSTLGVGTAVSASGTAVDFTGIPSWVKRITVSINDLSLVGNSDFIIRLSSSSSFATSGYSSNGYRITPTAAGTTTTAGLLLMTYAASALARGIYTLVLQDPSTNNWVGSGSFVGTNIVSLFSGSVSLAGSLDGLRITTSGGTDTFDAGTINIMYEG